MTERRPNNALREVIHQANVSYEQLARDVRSVAAEAGNSLRTNKSCIAHWVSGKRPASSTVLYLAEALSRRLNRPVGPADIGFDIGANDDGFQAQLGLRLEPDPVGILVRIGEADVCRRRLFTSAAYSVAAAALPLGAQQAIEYQQRATVGRAGRPEIAAVRDMTSMYTAIDERHGGQHGRSAVVQYLTSDVAKLCRATFKTEKDRAEMLSAAACLAYLCGWKSYDAGEHGLAQRYYLQAYQLTRGAGDDLHGAFILRILAHNGMDIERPEHTLELAEAALTRVKGKLDPAAEAMFAVTRARALANSGRAREAMTQARQAQDLVLRGDERELPYWAALWGSARACVSSHTAKTLKRIGDHAAAERHYAAAARGRPGRDRITALTLAAQAEQQAVQGHLEQACSTWDRALNLLEGVRSTRAADAVHGMRRHLRSMYGRGVKDALHLDGRARTWQENHA